MHGQKSRINKNGTLENTRTQQDDRKGLEHNACMPQGMKKHTSDATRTAQEGEQTSTAAGEREGQEDIMSTPLFSHTDRHTQTTSNEREH
jgi:hypothetical protein